jgi:hypothetical protein
MEDLEGKSSPLVVQTSFRASEGLIARARLAGPIQARTHAASMTADVTARYRT